MLKKCIQSFSAGVDQPGAVDRAGALGLHREILRSQGMFLHFSVFSVYPLFRRFDPCR
jgi:hypothetical protein